ncbi:MAG TPA: CHAP domain-containing protein [Clostridiales bacterium]|nr:CHAP domain-containing protein [Clostridiales bacterium]
MGGVLVYHCCKKAGFSLPTRYPSGSCRFAGVYAWLEWARLDDVNYFHSIDENSFMPERGDIVIYEKLITDESNDHIGIMLSCDDNNMLVAEGNKDSKNQSGVIRRSRYDKILGFIRIDNNYQNKFTGVYDPKLD